MRTLLTLLMLSSCTPERLSVYTETVDFRERASFQVGTPDPELSCPDYGQRLQVSWFVPGYTENTQIKARIRFKNLTEIEWIIPITDLRGRAAWCLLNGDYDTSGGILTYKIMLIEGDTVLEETHHALWTELILF